MFYKIVNEDSEIYKNLKELRIEEIEIEEENRKRIKNKIPYKWNRFLGYKGQQNFSRVTTYCGFEFEDADNIDLKIWKQDNINTSFYTPNARTKTGREMRDFLNNDLKTSSLFKLMDILGCELGGRFSFPYIDVCNDIIVMYLDEKWNPKDENLIEITSKEFNQIRSN